MHRAPALPAARERGLGPGAAGETRRQHPCPTGAPLFLASRLLSDKARAAPRAARRGNHPPQTTGTSGGSPTAPQASPTSLGSQGDPGGAGTGVEPGGEGASWEPTGASADTPHRPAQSGPHTAPPPSRRAPGTPGRLQSGACGRRVPLARGQGHSLAWPSTGLHAPGLMPSRGRSGHEPQAGRPRRGASAPSMGVGEGRRRPTPARQPRPAPGPTRGAARSVSGCRGHSAWPPDNSRQGRALGPGSPAYLVLHAVQAGADGVAAAVLALLCGAETQSGVCVAEGEVGQGTPAGLG